MTRRALIAERATALPACRVRRCPRGGRYTVLAIDPATGLRRDVQTCATHAPGADRSVEAEPLAPTLVVAPEPPCVRCHHVHRPTSMCPRRVGRPPGGLKREQALRLRRVEGALRRCLDCQALLLPGEVARHVCEPAAVYTVSNLGRAQR